MSCLCKQCRSRSVGFSGSALFAMKYVNLYQQSESSNLIGRTRVKKFWTLQMSFHLSGVDRPDTSDQNPHYIYFCGIIRKIFPRYPSYLELWLCSYWKQYSQISLFKVIIFTNVTSKSYFYQSLPMWLKNHIFINVTSKSYLYQLTHKSYLYHCYFWIIPLSMWLLNCIFMFVTYHIFIIVTSNHVFEPVSVVQ